MSVVLPIPLGPTMAMRAPLTTENDTPLKISVGPYDFASELTVMSDMFFFWQGHGGLNDSQVMRVPRRDPAMMDFHYLPPTWAGLILCNDVFYPNLRDCESRVRSNFFARPGRCLYHA